jgi:hypothetical protein
MITQSIVRTIPAPKGWTAEYVLAGEKEPHKLCDALGRPIVFQAPKDAKIAAQEALIAAMERAEAAFIDPHPDRFWLEGKFKTGFGRKLQAEKRLSMVSKFKEGAV